MTSTWPRFPLERWFSGNFGQHWSKDYGFWHGPENVDFDTPYLSFALVFFTSVTAQCLSSGRGWILEA